MFTSPLALLTAAMLRLATCATVDSPNEPIPSEWVDVLPMAWDNTDAMSKEMTPEYQFTKYHNWALDQIMDGNGTVNVCMRWHSNLTLDEDARNALMLQQVKQYQQWLEWLPGWDNFPFKEIDFKVVAWAVANDSQLVGHRDNFHVYTEFKDDDGLPTCDPGCSRHLHPDGDYSDCALGPDHRFHHYFMIDNRWGDRDMGAAGGEGFSLSEYGWKNVGAKLGNWPILVHETGHTFGFRDYINDNTHNTSICSLSWLPPNVTYQLVMEPTDQGAHLPKVTRFEGWFIRYIWSRFSRERGWQKDDGTTFPPTTDCPSGSF
ncbi:hypothetical protein Focb16_v015433 [Fusarium oxysporum f. sp. cubense]|uniref:Uncharacterized protein n=1 Tax=Fusarium oxysporum f. sp. cubense TaxID=61366 RepID=A0A559KXW3_FUSOC|nr:hypothetical protein Focb16_v015433 [Fusarium oxysporum f. sp. cubense]